MKLLSPLDDRYKSQTASLAKLFSESSYIAYQAKVEQAYLEALLEELSIDAELKAFLKPFSEKEIELCKQLETKGIRGISATHHDVKAIEYILKQRLKGQIREFVHFGLTSEDTSNLALGLMLRTGLKILTAKLRSILRHLQDLARTHKKSVMLARTHGQFAVPTTFGKEMQVFADRLAKQLSELESLKIEGKLNGSVGTLAALRFAYPEHDWVAFSKAFVEGLGLQHVEHTTQILPADSYVKSFQALQLINSILIGFSQDIWRYISDDWISLKQVDGDIGSSVMPQKVNPINFENAEGNLKLANGILELFARELPISRLQRDLSDKTIKRNFGVALGHSLLAYSSLEKGLAKLEPNLELMRFYCKQHPEVLAEAYQTELRKHIPEPYEKLKALTRGKLVSLNDLHNFVDSLNIPDSVKHKLKQLKPEHYI